MMAFRHSNLKDIPAYIDSVILIKIHFGTHFFCQEFSLDQANHTAAMLSVNIHQKILRPHSLHAEGMPYLLFLFFPALRFRKRQALPFLRHQNSVLVYAMHLYLFQICQQHQIRSISRRHRADMPKSEIFRRP